MPLSSEPLEELESLPRDDSPLEELPLDESPLEELPLEELPLEDSPLDAPPLSDALPSPERVEPADPSVEPPEAAAAFVLALEALDRSFLAQPDPLKWTAGGANALRRVSSAPHAGQNRGAGASMPWMNSVRVEQLEQT